MTNSWWNRNGQWHRHRHRSTKVARIEFSNAGHRDWIPHDVNGVTWHHTNGCGLLVQHSWSLIWVNFGHPWKAKRDLLGKFDSRPQSICLEIIQSLILQSTSQTLTVRVKWWNPYHRQSSFRPTAINTSGSVTRPDPTLPNPIHHHWIKRYTGFTRSLHTSTA